MTDVFEDTSTAQSGLELFVRDYVEAVGGVWDEIEPQVYDLLLPADAPAGGAASTPAEERSLRVAFDPEALPEHPRAQLASFGTPLVDRLLAEAVDRGRHGELHLMGLNLDLFNLPNRLARGLTLADDLELRIERIRAFEFPIAAYWFEATFISDQKEQEIVSVAIDLHSGARCGTSSGCSIRLGWPTSRRRFWRPLRASSRRRPIARREQVLRTLTGLANLRGRELQERLKKQAARMTQYYDDLLRELDEEAHRARNRDADANAAKFANRRTTIERERHTRIAELHHKNALTVELELLNFLVVRQPKLAAAATIADKDGAATAIELIWDPLLEAVEPVPCSVCGHPTFALVRRRRGELTCPACGKAKPPAQRAAGRNETTRKRRLSLPRKLRRVAIGNRLSISQAAAPMRKPRGGCFWSSGRGSGGRASGVRGRGSGVGRGARCGFATLARRASEGVRLASRNALFASLDRAAPSERGSETGRRRKRVMPALEYRTAHFARGNRVGRIETRAPELSALAQCAELDLLYRRIRQFDRGLHSSIWLPSRLRVKRTGRSHLSASHTARPDRVPTARPFVRR